MPTLDLASIETSPFEPTPAHARLAAFVGSYRGTMQLWMDPEAAPDESPMELHAELILGGRWLRMTTRGQFMGKPHAGEMLLGYHKDAAQYELAWVDSVHTGSAIIVSVGAVREQAVVDVLGSYRANDQQWGWRTRLSLPAAGEVLLEAFNIPPGAREEPALRARLTRG